MKISTCGWLETVLLLILTNVRIWGFLALGPTEKKLLSVKVSLFSPKIAISATVGPITISTTDLKSLKKVRKHCNSLYIAKRLPFLCYIHFNVILGPPIAEGTLIVSYVAH